MAEFGVGDDFFLCLELVDMLYNNGMIFLLIIFVNYIVSFGLVGL